MFQFNATDERTLERFKYHLKHVSDTNITQNMTFKKDSADPGSSMNFMVPVTVPPHFITRDPEHNTLGDVYLSREEAINEISELLFDRVSLTCIENMLNYMEELTQSELLFIRPHTSLTSLFISTPRILILMVIES